MLGFVTFVLSAITCDDLKDVHSMHGCCTDPDASVPTYDLVDDAKATFLLTAYRTGPYASNGIPFADGVLNYINHQNEKTDNTKLRLQECETGYSTQKAVSCLAKYHTATAAATLSTGSVYALSNSTNMVPLIISGYGAGAKENNVVHFSAPTYENAVKAFVDHNPSAKKLGYLHMPIAYGNNEIPYFKSLAESKHVELHTFSMGFPEAWGYGVTNHTDVLKDATDIDAFFMMPWGDFGIEWLDAALKLGIPASKFTTIWWGGREVIKPRFDGVKVASFVDPNHAPLSFSDVPIENQLIMSMGIRDAMVFEKAVKHAKTPTQTIQSGSNTYTVDEMVTREKVQQILASKMLTIGDGTFTNICTIGGTCNAVSVLQYSANSNKFIKL